MALTELQIKQLKPKEKRYTVSDGRGLIIEIHPNGSKYAEWNEIDFEAREWRIPVVAQNDFLSKKYSIYEGSNNTLVNFLIFGKTYCFTSKSFNASS